MVVLSVAGLLALQGCAFWRRVPEAGTVTRFWLYDYKGMGGFSTPGAGAAEIRAEKKDTLPADAHALNAVLHRARARHMLQEKLGSRFYLFGGCTMDGSYHRLVFTSGLIIDYTTRVFYWADAADTAWINSLSEKIWR